MTSESGAVAVELAQLRGEIATGLARIEGSLAVLVERSTRTEQDLRELRQDTDEELAELRAQVAALQARRWPLPAVGALTGAGALLVSIWGVVAR